LPNRHEKAAQLEDKRAGACAYQSFDLSNLAVMVRILLLIDNDFAFAAGRVVALEPETLSCVNSAQALLQPCGNILVRQRPFQ